MKNKYIKELDLNLNLNYLIKLSLTTEGNLIDGHRNNHRLVAADPYMSKIKEIFPCLSPIYNVNHLREGVPFPIHMDSDRNAALNIPIQNTANSFTTFYENPPDAKLKYDNERILHEFLSPVDEVFRFTLNKPTIINTSIPHSVIHPEPGDRVILSWSFLNLYNFEQACEIFNDDVVSDIVL